MKIHSLFLIFSRNSQSKFSELQIFFYVRNLFFCRLADIFKGSVVRNYLLLVIRPFLTLLIDVFELDFIVVFKAAFLFDSLGVFVVIGSFSVGIEHSFELLAPPFVFSISLLIATASGAPLAYLWWRLVRFAFVSLVNFSYAETSPLAIQPILSKRDKKKKKIDTLKFSNLSMYSISWFTDHLQVQSYVAHRQLSWMARILSWNWYNPYHSHKLYEYHVLQFRNLWNTERKITIRLYSNFKIRNINYNNKIMQSIYQHNFHGNFQCM